MELRPEDVTPSLVAWLSPDILWAAADVRVSLMRRENAPCTSLRMYLVLALCPRGAVCVPLTSQYNQDRRPMNDDLKTGSGTRWRTRPNYTAHGQLWLMSVPTFLAAAQAAEAGVVYGNRTRYAVNNPSELREILALHDRRAPFIAPSECLIPA